MDTEIKDSKSSFNIGVWGLAFVIMAIMALLFSMNSSVGQKDQRNQQPVPQVRIIHLPLQTA